MDGIVRLTHEQDGALRRLTYFERSGMRLAPALRELRLELRGKDYRTVVREPWEKGVTPRADEVAHVGGSD